ncbi:hypothetical protein AB0F42_24350 [Streptomyces buecherae]|uniref:hypothetical protein n=1 Tax=Streptomyces buecherae TaxID=2763006 RepID=UPI00340FDC5E
MPAPHAMACRAVPDCSAPAGWLVTLATSESIPACYWHAADLMGEGDSRAEPLLRPDGSTT